MGIPTENVLRIEHTRDNLHLSISQEQDKMRSLIRLLKSEPFKNFKSMIIYVMYKRQAYEVAQTLKVNMHINFFFFFSRFLLAVAFAHFRHVPQGDVSNSRKLYKNKLTKKKKTFVEPFFWLCSFFEKFVGSTAKKTEKLRTISRQTLEIQNKKSTKVQLHSILYSQYRIFLIF